MSNPLKTDAEYYNIKAKKYYADKQQIKDAPKFRKYILWLWNNKDKTVEEVKQDKVREYMKTYYAKKKRLKDEDENR